MSSTDFYPKYFIKWHESTGTLQVQRKYIRVSKTAQSRCSLYSAQMQFMFTIDDSNDENVYDNGGGST